MTSVPTRRERHAQEAPHLAQPQRPTAASQGTASSLKACPPHREASGEVIRRLLPHRSPGKVEEDILQAGLWRLTEARAMPRSCAPRRWLDTLGALLGTEVENSVPLPHRLDPGRWRSAAARHRSCRSSRASRRRRHQCLSGVRGNRGLRCALGRGCHTAAQPVCLLHVVSGEDHCGGLFAVPLVDVLPDAPAGLRVETE